MPYNAAPMPSGLRLYALSLLVALSCFITPAQRELFVGDETKYGQIVREMRATGTLLVPSLEGEPYTHKPPLHFWAIWLLTFVFGIHSTWPFVLPSLVAYLAILLVVSRLGHQLYGERAGALAVFVTASFYLMWGIAQTARMDLEFVFFISLGALYLFRFLERERPRDLLLASLMGGIAILFKGPMAAIILMLVLGFEAALRRRLPRGPYLVAFAIVAAVPLLWLVPAIVTRGDAFAREILVTQNVGRAFDAWVHKGPPWFYLARSPVTLLPWFFIVVLAIADAVRRRRIDADWRASRYLLSWIAGVLVPFSIISSKLDVYILPAMVPAALLAGRFLDRAKGRIRSIAVATNVAMVALLTIGFPLALLAGEGRLEGEEARLLALPLVRGLFWATAAAGLAALAVQWLARRDRLVTGSVAMALVALVPLVWFTLFLVPHANANASSAPLVDAIVRSGVPPREVALYSAPHLWSRGMPPAIAEVDYIGAEELATLRPRPSLVVTRISRAERLGAVLGDYELTETVHVRLRDFGIYRKRADAPE
jgi:4-amino-4-deoxy-L-arabinose transferase-like glycosyltransferase